MKPTNTDVELFNFIRTQKFVEREFSPMETMEVLIYNRIVYLSWGVARGYRLKNCLILKVNGRFFKNYVVITLAYDDTYTVRYIYKNKGEFKVKHIQTNVYFDELQKVIDDYIETVGN